MRGGGKRGGDERGVEGGKGRGGGWEERGGRGGLSGNVAEEAFCLKSAPDCQKLQFSELYSLIVHFPSHYTALSYLPIYKG